MDKKGNGKTAATDPGMPEKNAVPEGGEAYSIVASNSDEARNAQIDEDLFFEAEMGETGQGRQTFYFTRPIVKLGDGTYGVVFEVREGATSYALKLLYQIHTEKTAEEQYRHEARASTAIKKLLRKYDRMEYYTGLIEILGRTNSFFKSPAGSKLENFFKKQGIPVSNFAVIMPLYKFTLKDVLEKCLGEDGRLQAPDLTLSPEAETADEAIPPVEIGGDTETCGGPPAQDIWQNPQQLADNPQAIFLTDDDDKTNADNPDSASESRRPTGYEVLLRQDFDERISTIIPYLRRVAQGLCALHAATRTHLDVKPANIFVDEHGEDVDVVLGDLGTTVSTNIVGGPTMQTFLAPQERPLGTRHYRSPEQKDYVDVAYVSAKPVDDTQAHLFISDPKFTDSIIEEGDYVEFSKRPGTYQKITKIERSVSGKQINKCITIQLSSGAPMVSDAYTQVIFHKTQDVRTDLFGLGALCFDLITAGDSPERFYENIRANDRHDEDVDTIRARYERLERFGATDPSGRNVFQVFRNDETGTYVPIEIVEFVLKCMLYQAKGTFYHNAREKLERTREKFQGSAVEKPANLIALEEALTDLNDHLLRKWPGKYHRNPLMHRASNVTTPSPPDSFRDRLRTLRTCGPLPLRLATGIPYLTRLCRVVIDKIKDGEFNEMEPENLDIRGQDLRLGTPTYERVYEKDSWYFRDLREDRLYQRLSRDINNPFVPNYFQGLRRPVLLQKNNLNDGFYNIRFIDDSPSWEPIQSGDWLTLSENLYRIVESSKEGIRIEKTHGDRDHKFETSKAVFHKDLNLARYYFYMLGIYLHQFFFAGYDDIEIGEPAVVRICEGWPDKDIRIKLNRIKEDFSIKDFWTRITNFKDDGKIFGDTNNAFIDVLYECIAIYLKLRVWNVDGAFYNNYENEETAEMNFEQKLLNNKKQWGTAADQVQDSIKNLLDKIYVLTGIQTGKLDRGIQNDQDMIDMLSKEPFSNMEFDRSEYDKMIYTIMGWQSDFKY